MKKNILNHKINLFDHYRKLWFFNFNRLKGTNFQLMREYFAHILIAEIEEVMPFWNKRILDVGGARGEFCKVINTMRKCAAVNLDPNPYKYGPYSSEFIWPNTISGFADDMPFKDNEFDMVICRGVLEHIPREKQQKTVSEMYRVTKRGGFCYIAVPPWYSPFGGHGLKPFHYLPFKLAKFLAQAAYKKKIDANSWAEKTLFPLTFSKMLKIISVSGFKLIATKDTHFRLHFFTRIPLIREVLVPTAVFILTKIRN